MRPGGPDPGATTRRTTIDGPWRAADGSPLRRSALRHGAIPALASALGVDPVPALARTAALCAADDDALSDRARDLVQMHAQAVRGVAAARGGRADGMPRASRDVHRCPGEAGEAVPWRSRWRVADVRGAPRAVRTRALREAARRGGNPGAVGSARGRPRRPRRRVAGAGADPPARGPGLPRWSRCPRAHRFRRARARRPDGTRLPVRVDMSRGTPPRVARPDCAITGCCADSENQMPSWYRRAFCGTLIVEPLA